MINVNLLLKSTKLMLNRNSPAILTGVAISGVAATSVLAVRATPRALDAIDKAENDLDPIRGLTALEKMKVAGKYYVPALCVGLATMGCIVGVNSIHMKRQAALMTVYTVTEKAFNDYQDKVKEQIGENKEQKVRDAVAQDRVNEHVANGGIMIASDTKSIFIDSFSNRQFECDMETVRKAVNDINHQTRHEFYASLNDFYTKLNIPRSKAGDDLGWNADTLLDVMYTPIMTDRGQAAIVMDYSTPPGHGFANFHG